MKARRAASIALAAALLIGTSACTLVSVNGTLKHYEPSDGTATTIGDLKLRNVLGISEDGEDVALVLSIINGGSEDGAVVFQYEDENGDKQELTVAIDPNSTTTVGHTEEEQLVLRGVGATVGGLLPVYVTFTDGKTKKVSQGKQIYVPILDGSTVEYGPLLPSPLPTPSATPSSTPESLVTP